MEHITLVYKFDFIIFLFFSARTYYSISLSQNNPIIDTINCPMNVNSFSDCSINTTTDGLCSSYNATLYIQCERGKTFRERERERERERMCVCEFACSQTNIVNSNKPIYSNVIFIILTVIPVPICSNGDVRLFSNNTNSNIDYRGRVQRINGYLQVCYNNEYHYVCGHSDANLNATAVVNATCHQLNYYSKNQTSYSLYTAVCRL